MGQDAYAEAQMMEWMEWYDDLAIETANLQLTALDNANKGFTWEVFQ